MTVPPVLVSVKAIDPRRYPFYGDVKLDPPAALATVLDHIALGTGCQKPNSSAGSASFRDS